LPEPGRHALRQPVAELARRHDDLPPRMRLVSHEVRQHVLDIEREVPPRVALGRRNLATVRDPKLQERRDAAARRTRASGRQPVHCLFTPQGAH
jgi:hypothetical protein